MAGFPSTAAPGGRAGAGAAPGAASPIPREHLAHLQRSVSIIVASRDARLQPHVMRALGCRVERQPLRVVVLLAQEAAAELLDDVRANDRIAVVFSEPSTHRTVQIKGEQVSVSTATSTDRELARDYVDRMVAEISSIGYPQDTIRMMFSHDPARLVAVSFAPTASFDQTPGARPAAPVSPT